MASPGFEFLPPRDGSNRVVKADGTVERMEISPDGHVLKKYSGPGGTFSSVQAPGETHQEFVQRVRSQDNLAGFRTIFADD